VSGRRRWGSVALACGLVLALGLNLISVPVAAEGGSNISVAAFGFDEYSISVSDVVVSDDNNHLTYSVSVASGPSLRVLILDYDNFISYLTGAQFQTILDATAAPTASGTVNLGAGGYFLVIDNRAGSSPAVYSYSYELGKGTVLGGSPGDVPLFVLALVAVVVVAVVAYAMTRKRKHPKARRTETGEAYPWERRTWEESVPDLVENPAKEPTSAVWSDISTLQFDYCYYCGERISPRETRCPRCGVRRPH
jgi:hypothetical protein